MGLFVAKWFQGPAVVPLLLGKYFAGRAEPATYVVVEGGHLVVHVPDLKEKHVGGETDPSGYATELRMRNDDVRGESVSGISGT